MRRYESVVWHGSRLAPTRSLVAVAFTVMAFAGCDQRLTTPVQPDLEAAYGKSSTEQTIVVSPGVDTILVSDTVRFASSVKTPKGRKCSSTVTWTSLNTETATVNSSGLVTGKAAGVALVIAAAGCATDTATVHIENRSTSAPSTWIFPGDDIQAKVSAHPGGTEFTLKAGVHRMQQVTPKTGNVFVGEPGAVMSGARLLTTFVREGSYWVATGQTQQGQVHGSCRKEADGTRYLGCVYPEDLFIDDQMLWQVTSLGEVGPGRWYFDYDADKIYFVDDPSGKKVETSVTRHAFTGSATGVTIRGLTIEKYANPAQHGAIHGNSTGDWVVIDNLVQLNHGVGIRTGHRMQVRNNRILRNGQLGIGGGGDDVVVEDNQIAYNHTAGFSVGWEAGGSKFVKTQRLTVRKNRVHDNDGPGLWTDIDNIYTLYEGNVVEDNRHAGIWHEISYDAVVRNNTVRRNGSANTTWLWGAGIQIANSSNVEVYGNLVEDNQNGIVGTQQNRGGGAYGDWKLRNFKVYDNTVRMPAGRSGIGVDDGDTVVGEPAGGNQFERNTYYVESSTSSHWHWTVSGGRVNWTGWRDLNQDVNGKVNP